MTREIITRIIPGLCLAALALGLAGCETPVQQRSRMISMSFHRADMACPPASTNTPGHHAQFWTCIRDVAGQNTDPTVAYSLAQEVKIAEDADAGRISESEYQVEQTRLRMETANQIDNQNAQANSVAAQQNASGAIGLLAVAGAVADIVLLTR